MQSVVEFEGKRPEIVRLPCGCLVKRGDRVTVAIPKQRQRKQPFRVDGRVVGFGTYTPTVLVRYQKKDENGTTRSYTIRPLETYVRKDMKR